MSITLILLIIFLILLLLVIFLIYVGYMKLKRKTEEFSRNAGRCYIAQTIGVGGRPRS